ncbi:MAG: EamA family transporter [Deltaproteobacteria bacterium]|jgi:transporter family protein|nr:EamA family transporter [Deltaproteobacteria bacterium]
MWSTYALLAALFASLTAILSKIGVKDVDPNLAVAIRVSFVLILVWGIALFSGAAKELRTVPAGSLGFLFLSAVATGLSWLFYLKALHLGDVSKVAVIDKLSVALTVILAVILLGEPVGIRTVAGVLLVTSGSLLLLA